MSRKALKLNEDEIEMEVRDVGEHYLPREEENNTFRVDDQRQVSMYKTLTNQWIGC